MQATQLLLEIGPYGIQKSYFTSPLKLGTPKTEDGRRKIVLMMASAGVLKGDAFEYRIHCHKGTSALITEQSYTKIFDTGDGIAKRTQHIILEEGASLLYCPQAVVPFAGSSFDSTLNFDIRENSELLCTDIVTAGRVGMGERFLFQRYRSRICVCLDGKPVWIDNCILEPGQTDMGNMILFDDYTHMGTLYYYGKDSEKKEDRIGMFCSGERQHIKVGMSKALRGVCVRVLAHTAQDIEEFFVECMEWIGLNLSGDSTSPA